MWKGAVRQVLLMTFMSETFSSQKMLLVILVILMVENVGKLPIYVLLFSKLPLSLVHFNLR